jgi:hypothetical protein
MRRIKREYGEMWRGRRRGNRHAGARDDRVRALMF